MYIFIIHNAYGIRIREGGEGGREGGREGKEGGRERGRKP
jgi:hypothetical protein